MMKYIKNSLLWLLFLLLAFPFLAIGEGTDTKSNLKIQRQRRLSKTDQIPTIFRFKTIYYLLPFWLTAILSLGAHINFRDLGYYLKLGEAMIEKRVLVSHDLFTHTFFGLKYVNSAWLSQVVLAFCEKMGGLKSLILWKTVLLLLAMGILYHLIGKQTKHYKITLIFIVFAVALGFTNWGLRPQLFAIPLFAFFYSHLFRKEKITNSSILLFSLLMILWVNLHDSFPLAIIMTGIFLLGGTADEYHIIWPDIMIIKQKGSKD